MPRGTRYIQSSFAANLFRRFVDRDTPDRTELIAGLKARLTDELGPDRVIIGEYETRRLYSHDLAEVPSLIEKLLFRTTPLLVVQPKSTQDILKILKFAERHQIPVFPRGVASWGFGGATPTTSGIVVDFSAMADIYELNPENMTLTVQPGARWGVIDQLLEPEGLSLVVYPSNRFCTVGGWLSTGGFGLNSSKYGHISSWIESIEVVTPEGGISEVHSQDSEFDLFFGTEGQIGLISRVTLKLVRRTAYSYPHLLCFDDDVSSFNFIKFLLSKKCLPTHVKFIDPSLLEQINAAWQRRSGYPKDRIVEEKNSVLLHFDDPQDEEIFERMAGQFPNVKRAPAYVASYLWLERFSPLKVQILGPSLLASEVIVPLDKGPKFIKYAKIIGRRYKVDLLFESHPIKFEDDYKILMMTMFNCDRRRILEYIFHLSLVPMLTRLGIRLGGRPYGIGIWNVPFFASRFSKDRIQRLFTYKEKSDPDGILNPRKFISVRSRFFNIPGKLFEPLFFNISMDALLLLSPILGRLLKPFALSSNRKSIPLLELCTLQCTNCGNCIAVCPSYLVTKHEGVTARSKLRLTKKILGGSRVTQEESERAFLCTQCGSCQDVCQTELPLLDAWRELESALQEQHGRPEEKIRKFIDGLRMNPDYLSLIGSEPY
jgi:FAD/FMN-containing dehydrogenase/ferredoxin